jgi:hypothetical protein
VKRKRCRASLNPNRTPFFFPAVIHSVTLFLRTLAAGQIAAQLRRHRAPIAQKLDLLQGRQIIDAVQSKGDVEFLRRSHRWAES